MIEYRVYIKYVAVVTFCVVGLFMDAACSYSQKRSLQTGQFVKEYPHKICFLNEAATLELSKSGWHLKMRDNQNKIQYGESAAPEFKMEGKWISVGKFNRILSVKDNAAELSVMLENGDSTRVTIERVSDSGFRVVMPGPKSHQASAIRGRTTLQPVEEVYGFGEMWNGNLAQRNQKITLWDHNGTPDECAYMPYYVSTQNYAFFLNYGGEVQFDVGKKNKNEIIFEAPTDQYEILLVSGDQLSSAVGNFLEIKGFPPVPPRWTFKPWFWLMSDPNKPKASIETLKGEHFPYMIERLHDLNIPIGATWLEPPWQTDRTTFIPNPDFSSNLDSLIQVIDTLGVKTLAWTVPYTNMTASNWEEAAEKGYLVKKPDSKVQDKKSKISKSGETSGEYYNYIDFYNPNARSWWRKQIKQSLDLGIKGFKLDAGQKLPKDAILYGGRRGKDVHNAYALEYNKVFYNELQKQYGDDFLMIPRAAWVGSSAYTYFKWPGDLSTSFRDNGLRSSVYSSLSLALSGIPYVATDIGGFKGRPAPEKVWIRWAQFGAMIPGMETLNMPWWYSDQAIKHFRYLAWLHTALAPYWMSLSFEAHKTGAPLIRPLVWNYQDDKDTWKVKDEFTIGDYLLVAPILDSKDKRTVYLPEGRWIDFWNEDKVWEGKQTTTWSDTDQPGTWEFPLFIKEGSIVPMDITNNETRFGWAESKGFITLAIWPKKSSTTKFLYQDREDRVPVHVNWKNDRTLRIGWSKTNKDFILRVHLQDQPKKLSVSNSDKLIKPSGSIDSFKSTMSSTWFFDSKRKNLWIKKTHNTTNTNLKIILEK